jgi:hypothetical protein
MVSGRRRQTGVDLVAFQVPPAVECEQLTKGRYTLLPHSRSLPVLKRRAMEDPLRVHAKRPGISCLPMERGHGTDLHDSCLC